MSNRHSYVTFDRSGSDITGSGTNENRVDYPGLAMTTTTTPVIPFALEGAFFKVLNTYLDCTDRPKYHVKVILTIYIEKCLFE